jgi:cytoplasmic iron level regulating protein YaaA (DUF328/UPF0246 family)
MNKKTLIVFACCNRKRPDGEKSLTWSKKQSIINRLSSETGQKLLESRHKLARRFNKAEGKDLGGDKDAPVLLMRAFERYDGNLYRKIDKSYWHKLLQIDYVNVLIVSALYGLLTPWEPIRDYNIMITDAFRSRFSLARWWKNQGLGFYLKEYIIRNGITEVHDFLSGSYSTIADPIFTLVPKKKIKTYLGRYSGMGSGADHHRGKDINKLLEQTLN